MKLRRINRTIYNVAGVPNVRALWVLSLPLRLQNYGIIFCRKARTNEIPSPKVDGVMEEWRCEILDKAVRGLQKENARMNYHSISGWLERNLEHFSVNTVDWEQYVRQRHGLDTK